MTLAAVILAGGEGARFGGGKLTAPYGEGLLIHGALRAAFAAPASPVLLATGHDAARVAAAAEGFAQTLDAGQRLVKVHAADHGEGMAATLRAAIKALPKTADGVFVFLGDMPRVPTTIGALLAETLQSHAAAAPTFEGRRGHPVLFARRLFPLLARLEGDQGARRLLDELGADLALAPVADPGVLFDVDRLIDLGR